MLAKCFEAIIGALYLDKGNEEQDKVKKVEEFLNNIHFFEKTKNIEIISQYREL